MAPPSWEFFLEFEFAFRRRVFKAINRERQSLVTAMKTAIHDTELYQDEFLTGLRVLSKWLPSTASSSSAPPRPAPAGPSGPLSETAELAKIVEDLSKDCRQPCEAQGFQQRRRGRTQEDPQRQRQRQGQQGMAVGIPPGSNSSRKRSSTSTCACRASDSSFISLQMGAKICFKFQKNLCSDHACPCGYHPRFRPMQLCSPCLQRVNKTNAREDSRVYSAILAFSSRWRFPV